MKKRTFFLSASILFFSFLIYIYYLLIFTQSWRTFSFSGRDSQNKYTYTAALSIGSDGRYQLDFSNSTGSLTRLDQITVSCPVGGQMTCFDPIAAKPIAVAEGRVVLDLMNSKNRESDLFEFYHYIYTIKDARELNITLCAPTIQSDQSVQVSLSKYKDDAL